MDQDQAGLGKRRVCLCQNFPGVVLYHLRALVLYIKKAVIQKTVFFHVPDPISAAVPSKR